jgi:hypothetical protein
MALIILIFFFLGLTALFIYDATFFFAYVRSYYDPFFNSTIALNFFFVTDIDVDHRY